MARFNIGDRARYIGSDFGDSKCRKTGTEQIILSERRNHVIYGFYYETKCLCCGVIENIREVVLEPLQKRPELGSLDEIEKLTGWRPGRVREAV